MNDNNILETIINKFKKKEIDNFLIKSIIDNHRLHLFCVIKYIVIYYPQVSAEYIVDHVINSNNTYCYFISQKNNRSKTCNIIECMLNIYNIKMCDDFVIKDIVCKNGCICFSRIYLYEIYKRFIKIINATPNYFLHSINVYTSLVLLITKTDVLDNIMFEFINIISKNPKNWKMVIRFIRDSQLFSTDYGDIIFTIRDIILVNDKLDSAKKNKFVTGFKNRGTLISILHRYNDIQKSINKIIGDIYISDISITNNVSIMKEKKINCVVTLTKKPIFIISGIEYTQIRIDDIGTVDFIDSTKYAIQKTLEYIKTNKIILIHCYKGLSRSVCFVILLLIHQGLNFNDAYDLVKKKRRYINPNPTFIKQIREYYELNIKNNQS